MRYITCNTCGVRNKSGRVYCKNCSSNIYEARHRNNDNVLINSIII